MCTSRLWYHRVFTTFYLIFILSENMLATDIWSMLYICKIFLKGVYGEPSILDNLEVITTLGWQLGEVPRAVNITFLCGRQPWDACEPDLHKVIISVL